jgi:hypothetical protein
MENKLVFGEFDFPSAGLEYPSRAATKLHQFLTSCLQLPYGSPIMQAASTRGPGAGGEKNPAEARSCRRRQTSLTFRCL